MKWFPGSINDAVATSKQRKAIFVVFVEGKDEVSSEVAVAVNDSEVSSRLEQDDFVAIRLESNSESYKFFAQIYQVVPVPSLFFIGVNGAPLEVVSGQVTSSDLAKKIDSILERVGKKNSPGSSTSLIDAERDTASASAAASMPKTSVSIEQTGTPVSDNAANLPDETIPKEPTTEEKVERARQLIELQRIQKIEKEREEEKKREIERRKLGKDVQMAKQKRHEAEIKLAHDELMREKAAEAAAKERVRQQIAQDKMERKQRELAQQQQFTDQQQKQQSQQDRAQLSAGPSSGDGAVARIQFRLPSGSPHMGKFDATSTFGSLRSYVASNIELPFQQFAMSTSFPRRDLTAEDDSKTLEELELVPTAVILILPVKNSKVTTAVSSADDAGFISRFIWALFAPIFSVYNYVVGYFTGAPASPPDQRRNDGGLTTGRMSDNTERFGRSVGQPIGPISRNRSGGGPATTVRSRGNVHRLHSGGDDNDENNTWNDRDRRDTGDERSSEHGREQHDLAERERTTSAPPSARVTRRGKTYRLEPRRPVDSENGAIIR